MKAKLTVDSVTVSLIVVYFVNASHHGWSQLAEEKVWRVSLLSIMHEIFGVGVQGSGVELRWRTSACSQVSLDRQFGAKLFFLAASDTPRLPNIQISFSEISGLLLLKRQFWIGEGLAALQTAVRCIKDSEAALKATCHMTPRWWAQ